jgi:hypothetical protein
MERVTLTSAALVPGDVIRVTLRGEALQFQVLRTTPIRGTNKRVTDIQVKLTPWPQGTVAPVLLFPPAKLWTVERGHPVPSVS